MKVTLQVNGQEMSFSEQELIAIVEEHFSTKTTKKAIEVVETPAVGKWFKVNPLAINQQLFEKKREDLQQETTRKLIIEAFSEVKKNPESYGKPFQTMMPEKKWSSKTMVALKELAESLGDRIGDWVQQSLEWAQRIANGETWEAICNEADTANWYRAVLWKEGCIRLVGGSREHHYDVPASYVSVYYSSDNCLSVAVPLVVKYK